MGKRPGQWTRRDFGAIGVGAAAAGMAPGLLGAVDERPNVLILVADDAGARHFGIYGNPVVKTPFIDRLGATGFVADNAILTTPQCSPSRISILTGKHPHATGAEDLHEPMPAQHRIIPSYLADAGYFTGSMRKQHFGEHAEAQFQWYKRELEAFPEFLDAAGEKPFFMWVGFIDPHRPYGNEPAPRVHAPEDVLVPPWLVDTIATRRDIANYYDEIARMDTAVGAMQAELERRGQRDNTMILFISDNGAPMPREKGTLYDAGVKTPFVVNWPDAVAEGHRHEGVVSVIDIAPTILDIAGISAPNDMHGKSMLEGLLNPSLLSRDVAFCQRNWHNCDEHMRAIRTERYKYIVNAYTDLPHGTPADTGSSPAFKELLSARKKGSLSAAQQRLFEVPRPRAELYDLDTDPLELNNRADDPSLQAVSRELAERLDQWRTETGDFPPWQRRRADNTDRLTGEKILPDYHLPPLFDTGN